MAAFPTPHDAKEFLVAAIVDRAQRDGVPLSEVERKIAMLVPGARSACGKEKWSAAVRALAGEDHYLLVLIDGKPTRPSGDFLKLVVTALAIVAALVAAGLFFAQR